MYYKSVFLKQLTQDYSLAELNSTFLLLFVLENNTTLTVIKEHVT